MSSLQCVNKGLIYFPRLGRIASRPFRRDPFVSRIKNVSTLSSRLWPVAIMPSLVPVKIFAKNLVDAARKRGIFIPVSQAELGVGSNKRPKDKFTRLLEVVHLFEQKLVLIKNPELRAELLYFPHGEHDDQVDAVSGGYAACKDTSRHSWSF